MTTKIDRDTDLSHGFDAGNYANAYETQDLTAGLTKHNDQSEAFRHAYTLGFFSSYELDEIPSDVRDQFDDAYTSEDGQRVLALGYTDAREAL